MVQKYRGLRMYSRGWKIGKHKYSSILAGTKAVLQCTSILGGTSCRQQTTKFSTHARCLCVELYMVIPCHSNVSFWTHGLMASDNSPRGRVSESWPWSCSGRRWWISQSLRRFWCGDVHSGCQAKVSVWTWRNLRVRTLRRNISAFPNLNVPCNSGIVLAWTNQLTVLDFAIGLKGWWRLAYAQPTPTNDNQLHTPLLFTSHNTSQHILPVELPNPGIDLDHTL